jgi:hypothetical protein
MGVEGKHKGNKFICHKAGKLRNTWINSIMNSLVLDVPAMATEPQHCTIFMLDGAIKICTLYSLNVYSVIVQTFNIAPYTVNHSGPKITPSFGYVTVRGGGGVR